MFTTAREIVVLSNVEPDSDGFAAGDGGEMLPLEPCVVDFRHYPQEGHAFACSKVSIVGQGSSDGWCYAPLVKISALLTGAPL